MQPLQQSPHGLPLRLGPRVAGIARCIQSTLVADADGVLVMVLAMGTDLPQWSALMHLTVAGDVIVVPDIFETTLEVVFLAPTERVVRRRARRAAVQHYQCNCSHNR